MNAEQETTRSFTETKKSMRGQDVTSSAAVSLNSRVSVHAQRRVLEKQNSCNAREEDYIHHAIGTKL